MSQVGVKGDACHVSAWHAVGTAPGGGTFEPFGVVFDGAEGRAVPQAAVDDGIDGQEIRHRGGEEHPPCVGEGRQPGAGQGTAGRAPGTVPAVPALTCEEGHVGVLGVVGTPGHAADVVPDGLQRVHL